MLTAGCIRSALSGCIWFVLDFRGGIVVLSIGLLGDNLEAYHTTIWFVMRQHYEMGIILNQSPRCLIFTIILPIYALISVTVKLTQLTLVGRTQILYNLFSTDLL